MQKAPGERYRFLLEMHSFARWLAPLVRWGLALVGLSFFVVKASLLLGTSYGFSERVYHGVVGLAALLGFWLLGVVLGRLIAVAADVAEVLVDIEVAAEKSADLTEQHLVPALNRLARGIEQLSQADDKPQSAAAGMKTKGQQRPAQAGKPSAGTQGRQVKQRE